MVPYLDGQAVPSTPDIKYTFVFGWCQHISDIDTQPLCSKDVFAGRMDGADPTAASDCMAYSGGNAIDDIDTMEITGDPQT